MLRRFTISEHQARHALASGEFDSQVVSSAANVAVVLTQGWCSDWLRMDEWLERLVELGEPQAFELDVWELIYDRVGYFREFLAFKETTFGNRQVPYVRYYIGGRLSAESNFVSSIEFLSHFVNL